MAVPAQYLSWGEEGIKKKITQMTKLKNLHDKGLLFWYPLNKRGLSADDIRQQKLLWKRNGMNGCYINEARALSDNAKLVDAGDVTGCPVLMFVSDGKQVSSNWIQYQNDFAKRNNAKLVQLDCGHYVHYYESERICSEIREFLQQAIT